jgi:hypothetical protein
VRIGEHTVEDRAQNHIQKDSLVEVQIYLRLNTDRSVLRYGRVTYRAGNLLVVEFVDDLGRFDLDKYSLSDVSTKIRAFGVEA